MRYLLLFFLLHLMVSCNNDKISRLETDVREIKQSLERIEAALNIQSPENNATVGEDTYNNSLKPTKTYSSKGRCNAITKKGTQCSRSARSGGYCWQHGG